MEAATGGTSVVTEETPGAVLLPLPLGFLALGAMETAAVATVVAGRVVIAEIACWSDFLLKGSGHFPASLILSTTLWCFLIKPIKAYRSGSLRKPFEFR